MLFLEAMELPNKKLSTRYSKRFKYPRDLHNHSTRTPWLGYVAGDTALIGHRHGKVKSVPTKEVSVLTAALIVLGGAMWVAGGKTPAVNPGNLL